MEFKTTYFDEWFKTELAKTYEDGFSWVEVHLNSFSTQAKEVVLKNNDVISIYIHANDR